MLDRSPSDLAHTDTIWHYTSFPAFFSILQNSGLWFTRLDHLRDPFEGRSPQGFKNHLMQRLEEHTRKGVVSCWTVDTEESDLMWYAYAPAFGVAIQSTKGQLMSAMSDPKSEQLEVGLVQYAVDWSQGTPETYAFLKRNHFKREREFRLYLPYEYEWEGATLVEPPPHGRIVGVNLQKLISVVWVSPTAPNWLVSVVDLAVKKYMTTRVEVKTRTD